MTAKTAAAEYVSLSQASKELGVSSSSVSYYVKQGKLATVEVAGHRAIERKALEAFTAERAEAAPPAHASVRRAVERDKGLTAEQREAIVKVLEGA